MHLLCIFSSILLLETTIFMIASFIRQEILLVYINLFSTLSLCSYFIVFIINNVLLDGLYVLLININMSRCKWFKSNVPSWLDVVPILAKLANCLVLHRRIILLLFLQPLNQKLAIQWRFPILLQTRLGLLIVNHHLEDFRELPSVQPLLAMGSTN